MKLPLYQVDAFTNRLFAGNPAAVVFCPAFPDDGVMQAVAAENNLAETAFVVNRDHGFRIRWFTPMVEVDLCGHATLAAAHVLFRHRHFPEQRVAFASRSGPLSVRRDGDLLYLDFPTDAYAPADPPQALTEGLSGMTGECYKGRDDFLVILESEDAVRTLAPDPAALMQVPSRGVIVSGPGIEFDFVSRVFAPRVGIPEDPATGSAHTTLIPYWAGRLGKDELSAAQLSRRGGELLCRHLGERVEIGGQAVTYLTGEIDI